MADVPHFMDALIQFSLKYAIETFFLVVNFARQKSLEEIPGANAIFFHFLFVLDGIS